MNFDVKITNDYRIGLYLGNAPAGIQEALASKWGALVDDMVVEIRDVKLGGAVLHRISGRLAATVQVSAKEVYGNKLRFVVRAGDASTPYARIQEYGGKTAAHDIFPVKKAALAFIGSSGNRVMASVVHHPGSVVPARSYMRSTLEEYRPRIRAMLLEAVSDFFRSVGK